MPDSNDFMDKFFAANPIPQETIEHFASIPFTSSFLQDKAYEVVPTYSRVLKPDGEDYFFARTVNTPQTIPHYITLRARNFGIPPEIKQSQLARSDVPPHKKVTVVPEIPDCVSLITFAPKGVDGHPGVVHGGMTCAILDETMGLMVMLHHSDTASATGPRDLLFTGNLSVIYRAPVPTPGEVIVRTWVTHRDGRKWYSVGQIVDQAGKVLVEAEGVWIVVPGSKL